MDALEGAISAMNSAGGYNGGGSSGYSYESKALNSAGGGGATHIATVSGLLETLEKMPMIKLKGWKKIIHVRELL